MTNSFQNSKLNAKNRSTRTLQIESLENRELLSVVSPFVSADDLTESVSALVSMVDPANVGFLTNTNQDIPLPPQYKTPQLAPTEGGLSVPLDQTAPLPLTVGNTSTTAQIAETPLVVELETPMVQTTPMAMAASSNMQLLLDDDFAPDSNRDGLVLNQSLNSAATTLDVRTKSTTSNKVEVSWNEIGAESYTVQYRLQNTYDAWTSKVVKGKTNLSISVKANQQYEVKVIPQGMAGKAEICSNVIALSKLTAKVVNRTDNSISIQVSNNATIGWIDYVLGIKTQSEKSYTYYDVYQGNNGYDGALSYSFQGNVLTINGLTPNTKYNFQLAQVYDLYNTWRSSISPYTNVSAATTGQKVTKIVVNTLDDTVNNDRYTSLREAIQKASDGAVITFANNLKGQTINLSSALVINKKITIDASSLYDAQNDEPGLTFKIGQNGAYSIIISGTKNATIKGVKFTSASGNGSGVYCVGQANSVFNIQSCYFRNLNVACWFDGTSTSSILNVDKCTISYMASYGLTNASSGRINVSNCDFWYCSVGMMNTLNSSLYVNKTNFEGNYKVFYNENGTARFEQCTFQYTTGYIIYNSGSSTATYYNCLVANNHIDDGWSCFWNFDQGHIYIFNSTFAHNYRTFRNDGADYTIIVQNSVCAKKSQGSSSVSFSWCIAFNDSGLDEYTFRPTANSPCVDASGAGSCHWTDKDLAGNNRCMGDGVDIGCYEYMPVETKTSTSGKTTIYWGDAGVASYTVQYRIEYSGDKWTTKTVKNKNELTIPVKNNMLYEVLVTPEGAPRNESNIILTGSLAKLGMKVINKTRNSISFHVSNLIPEPTFKVGIKKQNENNFVYYEVISSSGKIGPYSYTKEYVPNSMVGNSCQYIFTITGLSSNTKYDFQFAQVEDLSRTIFDSPSYAISTYTKMSVVTTK